jgi:UDP-glucose 4-epimerase
MDESAALRDERFIYRDETSPEDDYEKLDVEEEYLARGGTILRLPVVYGEGDPQRREEFILRRCRAKRKQIPIGVGSFLWSRGYVGDIACAARLALEHPEAAGEIFNVCETKTWSFPDWAERIALAAGWEGEFVTVADDALPADMRLTRSFSQDLLFDASKARSLLEWVPSDPETTLKASVAWHLANPPVGDNDFGPDDAALRGS